MGLRTFTYIGLCTVLAVAQTASSAPVSKGRPASLAADWLREGNARLGKNMSRQIRAEIPYRNTSGDIIFYAIPLAPQGVIIVSSDDLIEPVIAFSDSGTTNDLAEGSPLFTLLTRDLSERNKLAGSIESVYAASAAKSKIKPTASDRLEHAQTNKAKWEKHAKAAKTAATAPMASAIEADPTYSGTSGISDIRIAPMLSIRWSQQLAQGRPCYNYYTPNNYYDGCVATAMAQLMRYWQYPTTGIGKITRNITIGNGVSLDRTTNSATTIGGDGSGGAYDWSLMPIDPETVTYSDAQWRMIGALCYDAGVVANMDYTPIGSSAGLFLADKFTQSFKFSSAHDFYTPGGIALSTRNQILISSLAAGFPVIAGIRNSGNNSGHAIIADGFGYSSGATYFHVNYGWGNSSATTATAWYNMPNMNSSPTAYDVVDVLVYNIFPTNSGEIVAGRIVNSTGALQNASVTIKTGSTNFTTVTDANGYYGMIVPGGATYTISATNSGYSAGRITNVVVGTSSTDHYGPCGNYLAQDITLSTDMTIPTLGEWGLILFMALILLSGITAIRDQRLTGKKTLR